MAREGHQLLDLYRVSKGPCRLFPTCLAEDPLFEFGVRVRMLASQYQHEAGTIFLVHPSSLYSRTELFLRKDMQPCDQLLGGMNISLTPASYRNGFSVNRWI